MKTLARPDARTYRHLDTAYIAALVSGSGLSVAACGARIGVAPRTMRDWLAGKPFPYAAQYALERLAHGA